MYSPLERLPVADTLMRQLFLRDVFDEFPLNEFSYDPRGWLNPQPLFDTLLQKHTPRLIIEVGTWLGASAIHMAHRSKQLGIASTILCIDTWLGALEFWTNKEDPDRYLSLSHRFGYPSVFYQFVANVLYSGCSDRVVPFPQTSAIAARWLRANGIVAPLIYIDGSHDYEDVLLDMNSYWQILEPGGTLFGDDYSDAWPGVVSAVQHFSEQERLKVAVNEGFWYFQKD